MTVFTLLKYLEKTCLIIVVTGVDTGSQQSVCATITWSILPGAGLKYEHVAALAHQL